jgi:hypothetical protein
LFDLIWLVVAYFQPLAGFLLPGLFELLSVMFALALAFAAVAYGFFILVASMGRIRSPLQILPILGCLLTGALLSLFTTWEASFQTAVSLAVLVGITIPMLVMKNFRAAA